MTNQELEQLKLRLNKAWASLTPEERSTIKPLFEAAHNQHMAFMTGQTISPSPNVPHNLMLAKSVLTNDWDGLLSSSQSPEAIAIRPKIGPEGEIYGFKKYEQLDLGWIEAVTVWLENLHNVHSFPNETPPTIQIGDNVTIGIAGDWGTGNWRDTTNPSPSANVAKAMSDQKPNITIHLGDVYYAGTNQQETDNLLSTWPAGTPDESLTFTMNSNHEMYSGANSYFDVALTSTLFSKQAGYSYFALENANWIIVCLDSAYYSDKMKMYLTGNLDTTQIAFLKAQAVKEKKVIVLTHHNGFDDSTSGVPTPNSLWYQVMSAFPQGKSPVYWYWGHVHTGVVYKAQSPDGTLCRCAGHGAIPWAEASILAAAEAKGNVIWYEKNSAEDPDILPRVLNGFCVLNLNGIELSEIFYDENNKVAWRS